ncbi:MAG: hypothetical protein IJ452_03345 [Butyricicoccus sp.]|nr:hypothetical protein [Butyricicoccus sp.]MBQ8585304.1 hypothetical protein [Butyricicoccus sp.]
MKYIAAIDAADAPKAALWADGVMLTFEDHLIYTNDQRLLIQSLLLDPPQNEEDLRLCRMLYDQTVVWLQQLESFSRKQLFFRLPDHAVDDFLPVSSDDFEALSLYTGHPISWMREEVEALRTDEEERLQMGSRMMIGNEHLFRTFLRALMAAAKQSGFTEIALLLPCVARCSDTDRMRAIVAECTAHYEIACALGIEIATPRAACYAGYFAEWADFMVFHTEDLAQLLYGMTRRESRKAVSHYLHENSSQHNVFIEFDAVGLGTLLNMAVAQIRAVNPSMQLGAIGSPVLNAKGKKFCTDAGIEMLILPQTNRKQDA